MIIIIQLFSPNRLTPSNGTAVEPQDFPLVTYQAVFEPGQPRTVPYRVNITNDMLEEYREHFFLTLSDNDPKVEVVDPKIANISIGESDGKYLAICVLWCKLISYLYFPPWIIKNFHEKNLSWTTVKRLPLH